jgi:DNA-directed RNA polymerase specialized sigma24 family protein
MNPDDLNPDDLTALLRLADHNETAYYRLYQMVEAELSRIAHAQLRGERRDALLDTFILVNDAFARLYGRGPRADPPDNYYRDRRHFFRLAARVIRHLRVEHARRRRTVEALGSALAEPAAGPERSLASEDLLEALHNELRALASTDPQAAAVFEVRFFGVSSQPEGEPAGQMLSERETAAQLGLKRYQIRCATERARRFLESRLPALGLDRTGGAS